MDGPGEGRLGWRRFGSGVNDELAVTDGLVCDRQFEDLRRVSRLLINPLCECEFLLVQPGLDELDRGEPAVCAMRPMYVVVDSPVAEMGAATAGPATARSWSLVRRQQSSTGG